MPRSLPPLTALRAFEVAARLSSFTRAARELHVTPAAVSHQIRGLETYLGVTTVIADPSGNVTFSAKFPLNPSAATPIVTATATDQSGNTSEFSACSSGG